MKYEVYNENRDRWVKVQPKIYRFLTQVRGYKGRKIKPFTTEISKEEEEDVRTN